MRCKFCHNPDTWDISSGIRITPDQLLNRAVRYRDFWGDDGGITFSGGEPMLQSEFICQFLELANNLDIHTAIDTAAQPFDPYNSYITRMLDLCSLVLLDIKHIDSNKHIQLCGYDNKNILECAEYLSYKNIPVYIRHVAITSYESDSELTRLAEFIKCLKNVNKIELLPYHTMGKHKWESLGLKYQLEDIPPASQSDIKHAEMIFRKLDLL